MTANEILERARTELVVAIEEEYGFKYWIWFPGLSGVELESWWQAMDDVETFWRAKPGTKERERIGWPGEFIDAEVPENLYDLWAEFWKTAPYVSHIDMNLQDDIERPDTYLKRRDGAVFIHRGATTREDEI